VTGTQDQRERQQQIAAVVLKIVGVAVAIGLVIGLGAWLMVKALGLQTSSSNDPTSGNVQPLNPLPSTALPVPSDSASASDTPTSIPTAVSTGLYLSASPVMVQPMERINLTGQWPGQDNESLVVQRFENGSWSDFGVQVRVNVGTFSTYVMTGRTGDQRFRVFDPATQTASNEVTVTVGS
jgi:hypothetical protein